VSVIDYVDDLVEGIGSRLAGSEGEYQASELIAARFEELGLPVQVEEFDVYPFTQWFSLVGYVLIVAGALLTHFVPKLQIAWLIVVLLGLIIVVLELFNLNPIHRLLPTRLSQNVVARYIPTGSIGSDRPRKVVVMAHYDTARSGVEALPFIAKRQKIFHFILWAVLALVLISEILLMITILPEIVITVAGYVLLAAAAVVAIALVCLLVGLFGPMQKGANNNASGVATLYRLAEMLSSQGAMSSLADVSSDRGRSRRQTNGDDSLGAASNRRTSPEAQREEQAGEAAVAVAGSEGVAGAAVAGAAGAGAGATGEVGIASASAAGAASAASAAVTGAARTGQGAASEAEITAERGGILSPGSSAAGSQSVAENLVQVGTERRNPFVFDRQPAADAEFAQGADEEQPDAWLQEVPAQEAQAEPESDMPEWFINARKNAEKKNEQRARREGESEIVRSRYADIPMSAEEIQGGRGAAGGDAADDGDDLAGDGANPGGASLGSEVVGSSLSASSRGVEGLISESFDADSLETMAMPSLQGYSEGNNLASLEADDTSEILPSPSWSSSLDSQFGEPGDITSDSSAANLIGSFASSSVEQRPSVSRGSLPAPDLSGIDRMATTVLQSDNAESTLFIPTQSASFITPEQSEAISVFDQGASLDRDAANAAFDAAFDSTFDSAAAQIQLPLLDQAESDALLRPPASEPSSPASPLIRLQGLPEVLPRLGGASSAALAAPDATLAASAAEPDPTPPASRRPAKSESGPSAEDRSFLESLGGRFSRNRKRDELTDSPSNWLGVDDDFEARKEGGLIGSWENFNDDDDDAWRGGAFGGADFDDDAQSLEALSTQLLDKEVWLVATGASELNHTGVKYFLNRHDRQLRGSLFITVLGVGAGDLCFTILEGAVRTNRTDQRLQNLLAQAAQEIAVPLGPIAFTAFDTDGSVVLGKTSRAISLIGMGNGVPLYWHNKDDSTSRIREDKINTASQLILETIKNS